VKVELNTAALKSALKSLAKIKGEFISEDILVKAVRDRVILSKSSTDIALNIKIYGKSEEEGIINLPSGVVDIIKKIKDDSLVLTENSITAGKKLIQLHGVVELDQSKEEAFKGDLLFRTTERELHKMLEVKYAVAQDETRPILTGICFNKYETCALDGYRISVRRGDYDSEAKFVLNKNTVNILDSLLNPEVNNECIEVYGDEKLENIRFSMGDIELIGKTMPGEFINYKSIIPEEHNVISSLDAKDLKEELDFLSGFKTNLLKLNFKEDKLTLLTNQCREDYDEVASKEKTMELQVKAHNDYKEKYDTWASKKAKSEKNKKEFKQKCPEEKCIKPQKVYSLMPISDIKIEVKCTTEFHGCEDFNIAVNPKYFIESIKTYNDKVELRMTSRVSPIVITSDGKNLELVLPVRVLD